MMRYQYKLRLLVYKSLLVHTPDYIIFGFAGTSRRRASSICNACLISSSGDLVVTGAADTSTNRRHGFLCRRTASMEHAADTVEVAAVDHYFPSPTENIFIPLCIQTLGIQTDGYFVQFTPIFKNFRQFLLFKQVAESNDYDNTTV